MSTDIMYNKLSLQVADNCILPLVLSGPSNVYEPSWVGKGREHRARSWNLAMPINKDSNFKILFSKEEIIYDSKKYVADLMATQQSYEPDFPITLDSYCNMGLSLRSITANRYSELLSFLLGRTHTIPIESFYAEYSNYLTVDMSSNNEKQYYIQNPNYQQFKQISDNIKKNQGHITLAFSLPETLVKPNHGNYVIVKEEIDRFYVTKETHKNYLSLSDSLSDAKRFDKLSEAKQFVKKRISRTESYNSYYILDTTSEQKIAADFILKQ